MKVTGIVRRIDDLGRVIIPKEIRKRINIREGDPLEVYTDGDAIVFKKYKPDDLVITEENPDFSSKEKREEKSSKLIIHETDYHGSGWVYYDKSFTPYSYDDETGDIRAAVEELIRLGFIKPEQVLILEGEQLYLKFAELLERE